MLEFIWAEDKNHLIGSNGSIPWHLSSDMKHFKKITTGKTILMGRKTLFSMPHIPLPHRKNLVLTKNKKLKVPKEIIVFNNPQNVLAYDKKNYNKPLIIIGGAQIFKLFLNKVKKLWVTKIDSSFSGNTYMPKIPWQNFYLVKKNSHQKDKKNNYSFTFETYLKI